MSMQDGSSLYCCPQCRSWSKMCGVGYCKNESHAVRVQRKASRISAYRFQTFIERLKETKEGTN